MSRLPHRPVLFLLLALLGVAAAVSPAGAEPDLASPDPVQRVAALEALGREEDLSPATVARIARALRDPEPSVRVAAARALGRHGRRAAPAVPLLGEALGDEDRHVRHAACEAVEQIGPPALPLLGRLVDLVRTIPTAIASATPALVAIGPEASAPLIAAARTSDDPSVRCLACDALGRIRPVAEGTLETLVEALDDPDDGVRSFASASMIDLGEAALPATASLGEALRTELWSVVRRNLVHALARFPAGHEESLALLLEALDDAHPDVWQAAARAVAARGAVAVPRLRRMLTEASVRARPVVAWTLALIGPAAASALPELEEAAAASDARLAEAARRAIPYVRSPGGSG